MGLFGRLFGRKSQDDLPPDVERAFKRLRSFLSDEEFQNAAMPDAWKVEIAGRAPAEVVPGGHGPFGRCITNPIPVNGLVGRGFYLSSLRISRGPVLFHRLGSLERTDCFEVVSADGTLWDLLYLDMYYPRRSRRAPDGYTIDDSEPLACRFYGTNRRVEPFPHALYDAIANYTAAFVGMRFPNPKVREILSRGRFVPPETHRRRVDELVRSRIWLAATDAEMQPSRSGREGEAPVGDAAAAQGRPEVSRVYTNVATRIMLFLEAQAARIPGFSMLDAQKNMKSKPAAYVYGFVEAALENAGVGLDEIGPGHLVLATVLANCVENGRGSSYTRLSISEQDQGLELTARVIQWIADNSWQRDVSLAMQMGREDFAAFAQGSASIRWTSCFE